MPERKDSEREVLTSLPRSRPVRRSAKRGDRPVSEGAARASAKPAAAPRATAKRTAAKPAAAPRATAKRTAAKPAAAPRASAKRTATKPPPAKPAVAKPTPSAERPRPRDTPRRKVPAAGYAAPDGRAGEPSASAGAELVSTAIQAAAELAQIGVAVGRQTLQSMIDRLPKP